MTYPTQRCRPTARRHRHSRFIPRRVTATRQPSETVPSVRLSRSAQNLLFPWGRIRWHEGPFPSASRRHLPDSLCSVFADGERKCGLAWLGFCLLAASACLPVAQAAQVMMWLREPTLSRWMERTPRTLVSLPQLLSPLRWSDGGLTIIRWKVRRTTNPTCS